MSKIIDKIKCRIYLFYIFICKIFYKTRKYFPRKKSILLYCEQKQFEAHVIDYIKSVKNIKNYKIYFYYFGNPKKFSKEIKEYKIKIVKRGIVPFLYVDLVVTACLFPKELNKSKAKVLYVNHGFHIVGRKDGEETFTYSLLYEDTKPNIICEPNKRIAELIVKEKPNLKSVVKWTGWKFSQKLSDALSLREKFRSDFGFKKEDKVIFVVSTWGENSLSMRYGESLFKQLKLLSKDYKIIISLHPKVFLTKIANTIKDELEDLKSYGVIIKDLDSDWIPYMIASDVVFSDYSTLTESAVSIRKKLVLSDYPKETIWKESVISKVKDLFLTVKDIKDLGKFIELSLEKPFPEDTIRYCDETKILRKDYEDKITLITNNLIEEGKK